MKTLSIVEAEAWANAKPQERKFRHDVLEWVKKGLMLVRKDTASERIEIIPTPSGVRLLKDNGMSPHKRSFTI